MMETTHTSAAVGRGNGLARPKKRSTGRNLLLLTIIGLFMGAAVAITVSQLQTKQLSIFGQETQAATFSIQTLDPKISGKNKIVVDVTLLNTDNANPHAASVTVQVLDLNGDLILESTKTTGSVPASGATTLSYTFVQTGLVALFQSIQVVIAQTA